MQETVTCKASRKFLPRVHFFSTKKGIALLKESWKELSDCCYLSQKRICLEQTSAAGDCAWVPAAHRQNTLNYNSCLKVSPLCVPTTFLSLEPDAVVCCTCVIHQILEVVFFLLMCGVLSSFRESLFVRSRFQKIPSELMSWKVVAGINILFCRD